LGLKRDKVRGCSFIPTFLLEVVKVCHISISVSELEDFIEYLKGKGIRIVGIVERVDRKATKAGVPMARYYFRLTSKDEEDR